MWKMRRNLVEGHWVEKLIHRLVFHRLVVANTWEMRRYLVEGNLIEKPENPPFSTSTV
jgi:hypothetical protein